MSRRSSSRWSDLAILAALLAAAPVGASARASSTVDPAVLAHGALACRGVPDELAAAERRIVERGWPQVSQRSGPPLPTFVRGGMMVMLIPPDSEGHPLTCGVLASVDASVSAADLAAAVSTALGRQPGPGDAHGLPLWELEGGQVVAVSRDHQGGVFFTFWYPRNRAH